MSFELFNHDGLGVVELFDYDWENDSTIIRTMQDCTHILEMNKLWRDDSSQAWRGKNNDWWRVASIPNAVILEWKQNKGVRFDGTQDDLKRICQLLDDPDNAYLKTAPVRLT